MNWFKLTLDKSGAILTCEQVDAAEKNGTLTCYVQATTKAEACSSAKAWYTRMRDQKNASAARIRAARSAAGLCRVCGRKPHRKGGSNCQSCEDIRKDRRARGAQKTNPRYASPDEALAAQTRVIKKCLSKRVHASAVLEILDRAGPDALRRWLVELIEKGEAAPPF